MTGNDRLFFQHCYQLRLVRSPLLEIGAAKVQSGIQNICDLARSLGIDSVVGVDLCEGPGVDFIFDFSIDSVNFSKTWSRGFFSTVAIFNVLEHTFDPLVVLQNALNIVEPGGTVLVVTPAIWPIHNYPADYVRLLPNWYEEFAKRNGITLVPDTFCWLSEFGITRIHNLVMDKNYVFPSFLNLGKASSSWRYWISRIVHRVFNTYGRSHSFTHNAIGAAFHVPQ